MFVISKYSRFFNRFFAFLLLLYAHELPGGSETIPGVLCAPTFLYELHPSGGSIPWLVNLREKSAAEADPNFGGIFFCLLTDGPYLDQKQKIASFVAHITTEWTKFVRR